MQEQVQADKKLKEAKTKKHAVDWSEVFTHVAIKAAEGFITGVALGVASLTVNSLARSFATVDSSDSNNLVEMKSKLG